MANAQQIWLIRHGETEWSRSGQHTGRTDIPLNEAGERSACILAQQLPTLIGAPPDLVLTSPFGRARRTCELAGYGQQALLEPKLAEWDYGDYEGISTPDIRKTRPGWSLWRDGVINGETAEHVGQRADQVLARIAQSGAVRTALFAHGHILRILTSRWLGLPPEAGRLFVLGTASVSLLGYEHDTKVIRLLNRQFEE
jgi:broad specificity phosphatase PhoE